MYTKTFDRSLKFLPVQDETGQSFWFPVVSVDLVQPSGTRISLPLLFDTGASITTLRYDLYPILGLSSWDAGKAQQNSTAGSEAPVTAYRYEGIRLEVFGKMITCPVNLMKLPPNPLFVGLLGRDTVFAEFGFGFWESSKELFVTNQPQVSSAATPVQDK
jgi:Aspartyl protease